MAESRLRRQAGLPHEVGQTNSQARPNIISSGYPGGWGMPPEHAIAISSPASPPAHPEFRAGMYADNTATANAPAHIMTRERERASNIAPSGPCGTPPVCHSLYQRDSHVVLANMTIACTLILSTLSLRYQLPMTNVLIPASNLKQSKRILRSSSYPSSRRIFVVGASLSGMSLLESKIGNRGLCEKGLKLGSSQEAPAHRKLNKH
jgi:hypothetical protein